MCDIKSQHKIINFAYGIWLLGYLVIYKLEYKIKYYRHFLYTSQVPHFLL